MAGPGKCIKRLVRNAKKNVKFLLSQGMIALYIVRIVFQNAKIAAVK